VKHAPVAHHGRNGVLEDQLLLVVVFQQHRILVERADLPGQLDAADQINRDGGLVLADRVQECVLNVLCRLGLHMPISCFLLGVGRNQNARTRTNRRVRPRKPRNRQLPQWLNNIGLDWPFQLFLPYFSLQGRFCVSHHDRTASKFCS
jgi:hypothetical protein